MLGKTKIIAVKLESNQCWESYKNYIHLISKERQDRISRMKYDVERIHSMVSELIARKYISDTIGIPFNEIKFRSIFNGKLIVDFEKMLSFNWSHSGDWILFAMDKEPVGIDVEKIRKIEVINIARRFFDIREVKQIEELKQKQQIQHFFKLWTLKESYIKWKGTGMETSLKSFYFVFNNMGRIVFSNNYEDNCYFRIIQLDSDYSAAICMSNNYNEIDMRMYNLDTFLKMI